MQPVGEFDQDDPNILRHRDNHLADGFRLGIVTVLQLVELRYTVDE